MLRASKKEGLFVTLKRAKIFIQAIALAALEVENVGERSAPVLAPKRPIREIENHICRRSA